MNRGQQNYYRTVRAGPREDSTSNTKQAETPKGHTRVVLANKEKILAH